MARSLLQEPSASTSALPFRSRPVSRLNDTAEGVFRPPLPADLVLEFFLVNGNLHCAAFALHSNNHPVALGTQIAKPFEHLGEQLNQIFGPKGRQRFRSMPRLRRLSALKTDIAAAKKEAASVSLPSSGGAIDKEKPFAIRQFDQATVANHFQVACQPPPQRHRWARALTGLERLDRLISDYRDKLQLFSALYGQQ